MTVQMTILHTVSSPLGLLTLASDGTALTGLWLAGQKHFAAGVADDAIYADCAVFEAAEHWLKDYFALKIPNNIPLAPRGTAFQMRVWQTLRAIPYGTTVTYGELADRLKSSPRAVGQAVGRNPISILIPCHRVLGANAALTGYAGGLDAKRFLLALEKSAPPFGEAD